MKIVEIRGYQLEAKMPSPVRNSLGSIDTRNALVIELVTDDGHSGWGETQRAPRAAWSFIETTLARRVIGADPFARNAIYRSVQSSGLRGETAMMAISAIDLALWDLCGRIEGQSIATLLGGAVRERVRAYASGPFMAFGEDPYRNVLADVQGYLDDGFTAFKVRSGFSPRADAELMLSLRRELGDEVAMAIDINTGYSRTAASEVARRCADAGLLWIEEPLPPFDLDGYVRLSEASSTPIAAGESLSELRDFRDVLARGAVSLIQPDLYLCGGITGAVAIAALADAYATPYLPHVFGTMINFYASLQLAAVLPEYRLGNGRTHPLFEFDRSTNPLRSLPVEPALNPDGTLTIPDGPGIGVDVSRELFEPFIAHSASIVAP